MCALSVLYVEKVCWEGRKTVWMPTPCITYTIGRALYVAMTNRCNAVSLIESRGPGFLPSKFMRPLPTGFEPSPDEVADAVKSALNDGLPSELCFAGAGEPLLRLRALEEVAGLVREQQPNLAMRINTNGLVLGSEAADVVQRLQKSGITSASIALMTSDSTQYSELMKPDSIRLSPAFSIPMGLKEVTAFASACISAGLEVECTAVERPGVDIEAAKSLAETLGASFRARTWHP